MEIIWQSDVAKGSLTSADLNPRVTVHYGIPATASVLACDLIQRLVAVGTLLVVIVFLFPFIRLEFLAFIDIKRCLIHCKVSYFRFSNLVK